VRRDGVRLPAGGGVVSDAVAARHRPRDISVYARAYLNAVRGGDRRTAVDLAHDLLDNGVPAESVILQVLVPAQVEIGNLWQGGHVIIAAEHRASAITEAVLQALVTTALLAPTAPREGSAGRAVVVCSEGEWHLLPGQLVTEVLRLRGVDASFVGPSTPADDLAEFLRDDPPGTVAITCSMPTSLAWTWRSVSVARELGLTVVCGGRGFGSHGRWASALGADEWAPDVSSGADAIMRAIAAPEPGPRPSAGDPEILREAQELRRDRDSIAEQLVDGFESRSGSGALGEVEKRAVRDAVAHTVAGIASGLVVGDDALVIEHVEWTESVLSARGIPLALLPVAFDLLAAAFPPGMPHAARLVGVARHACTAAA
jgi:methanogenic corrinoid protein MtbC1